MGQRLAVVRLAEVSVCGEKDLECRQALLAVDDLADHDMPDGCLFLGHDHRAEKVEWTLLRSFQGVHKLALDVFPKRRPLLLLAPDVLALEKGGPQGAAWVRRGTEGSACGRPSVSSSEAVKQRWVSALISATKC